MVKWNRSGITYGVSAYIVAVLTAVNLPCFGDDLVAFGTGGTLLMIGTPDEENSVSMQSIVEAVEAQIADLGVELEVRLSGEIPSNASERSAAAIAYLREPGILAVFWCLPEATRYRAYVYFPTDSQGAPKLRDVEVAGPDGTGETLAVILRASIISLLQSRKEMSTAAVAPPPQPPKPLSDRVHPTDNASIEENIPLSKPTEKNKNLLRLEGAYTAAIPSADWQPIHGALLSAGLKIFDLVRIHLSYTVAAPYHTGSPDLALTVRHHPIGLGMMLFFVHKIVEARFRLSLCIDYATTEFSSNNEALSASSAAGQVEISMQPNLEAAIAIVGGFKIFFGLGMNVFLTRPKYTVQMSDGPKTVFDPWAIQPVGTVGVSGDFF